MIETEEDIALEAQRRVTYYETRDNCALSAKVCRTELGGHEYEDWYYILFSKVCFELKSAHEGGKQMVPEKVLLDIGQLALTHIKGDLEKHAERNT